MARSEGPGFHRVHDESIPQLALAYAAGCDPDVLDAILLREDDWKDDPPPVVAVWAAKEIAARDLKDLYERWGVGPVETTGDTPEEEAASVFSVSDKFGRREGSTCEQGVYRDAEGWLNGWVPGEADSEGKADTEMDALYRITIGENCPPGAGLSVVRTWLLTYVLTLR